MQTLIKSGLTPIVPDHRDYDHFKTFGSVGDSSSLPDMYSADAGLWIPNQETGDSASIPPVPPMPNGCTDYAQTDLCIDEDNILHSPLLLEQVTHANADGGTDIRTSLKAAIQVFQRTAYFNVNWQAPLDAFDSIRLALYSTEDEKRAVSVGTPFFQEWLSPESGMLPFPQSFSTTGLPWHNYVICGWTTMAGIPYLICKMWLGNLYGAGGFVYMSRELCNSVLNINGSGAFTLSKVVPGTIQTIDMDVVQRIVSFMRNVLGLF